MNSITQYFSHTYSITQFNDAYGIITMKSTIKVNQIKSIKIKVHLNNTEIKFSEQVLINSPFKKTLNPVLWLCSEITHQYKLY